MDSVKIGDKKMYNDFNLILCTKTIEPPKTQTNRVEVPLRDGSIDLTAALTGIPKYEDREITMTFMYNGDRQLWPSKFTEVANYMHGKELKIIFDDDTSFYYIGRVEISEWKTNRGVADLEVKCTCNPYKYDVTSSSVDWEWDIFDFETGIINETGQLIINGSREITLICRSKIMVPTITASTAMTVEYDNETFSLKSGSQKIYDLILKEGNNNLKFTGNGTVTIDYIGGVL